ncbi:C40 family peptidase [Marinirhabdus gelatinilytica]|uniref:SH3 domain-containing protein n=1 Tax=Marinirhabdus gelatinilytica TaxID=1703343 RepID=A0A370QAC8_9FLAO|nr:C40 family peptidase [Marinirhabdus gelatinilytica]RDK85292.1 SH3 domain-containing protein [Marinirhabdus gelatinilytica]
MKYGLCNLSIVPLRLEAADTSEMVTQVLYGETFKVVEQRKKWSRIRLFFDTYEGWIDNKQFVLIAEEDYHTLNKQKPRLVSDLVGMLTTEENMLLALPLGCNVAAASYLKHISEGTYVSEKQPKAHIVDTALLYLNAPYLWGGKTPFGIDCSGFTQMCYKLNGYKLLRDASQQATQGEPLSFIEESEPGDLAFFDNTEGDITHVGIIMKDNYIIHAHGKVRIDRIDHTGIFNYEQRQHTHKLRVIKRIV